MHLRDLCPKIEKFLSTILMISFVSFLLSMSCLVLQKQIFEGEVDSYLKQAVQNQDLDLLKANLTIAVRQIENGKWDVDDPLVQKWFKNLKNTMILIDKHVPSEDVEKEKFFVNSIRGNLMFNGLETSPGFVVFYNPNGKTSYCLIVLVASFAVGMASFFLLITNYGEIK